MKTIIVAGAAIALLTGSALAGGRGNDYQQTRPVNTTAIAGAAAAARASAVARQTQSQSQRQSQIANGGSVSNSGNSSVKMERSAPGFGLSGSSGGKGTWHFGAAVSTPAGGGGLVAGGTERYQKCIDRAEFVIRIDGRRAAQKLYADCDSSYRKILGTPKKP